MNNIPAHKNTIFSPQALTRSIRFLRLITVLLSFLCLCVTSAQADHRVVRVGIYENAPKVFTSDKGRPSGIFVDVIEYIAKSEGWELNYVAGTWTEGLDRLAKGEIDLMPDVAYTADRAEIYSFHEVPVLSSWYQVYAPKGSDIHSILDLKGKRILVLERSVQQKAFERLNKGFGLDCTLIPVPDYKTMFERVARGEADAALANRFYGLMHAQKFGLEDTAIILEPSDLFFAAPKNASRELLNTIDKHMSALKKDHQSIYYRSLTRWTSEEVRFRIPLWMKIAGLIAGVILLMSLGGSIVLKRQVNARTKELRRINQEMEQRIIERTAELAEAMEKAQAADRLKSAFLATMSHELRTPLNSIIGFTSIILRERVGPLNDEQKKQLNMVRRSSQHLLALINDVLDISKIEAGQLTLAQEEVDLRQIIEKVEQSTRPLADSKELELYCEIASEISTIPGDSRRIEQILLNLLSNAIKFTEKGSVKIVCESDDGNVMIKVIDTGIGIKTEDTGIIFETFRQIDSGISRKYDGTGLGLPISKKLAELMGGKIRVTSIWGSGSTFSFSLPMKGGNP